MLGRRLLILVAVLMGLTALAASIAPPPESTRRERAPAATPTPAPTPERAGAARTIERRLHAGGAPARVRADRGDTVVLDVRADVIDTVAILGMAALEPVTPDSPAHFELYADTPGRYAIRLLDADRRIGVLDIRAG